LYEEVDPTTLKVPIGYVEQLSNFVKIDPTQLYDRRTQGITQNSKFVGELRPYQERAINALDKSSIGVISAPTGSGKTAMMCALIARKNVSTLVLVNTLELAQQFKASLLKFTDLAENDVHIIQSGATFKLPAVTIALLQSMATMDDIKYRAINTTVGMVLTDEVHIVGAKTYYETLNKLSAKYKYGFSATPEREDGLTSMIFLASGNLRAEVTTEEVGVSIMIPDIMVVKTNYYFPLFNVSEYTEMISDLSNDKDRNQLIVDTMNGFGNKQRVILCTRVMQCVHLQNSIPGSKLLVGGFSEIDKTAIKKTYPTQYDAIIKQRGKKYRKNVVKEINDGTLTTVISTYKLFSTGLDFPDLEIVGFGAPLKSKILVKQCRGRIMRSAKGKQPICVDFEDSRVELLRVQAKTRQRILRKF
jgi:superfamily II DNA or RNA helicase